ncbi:hypothetical protein MAPG_01429 [Magnaporthiopsis poae ATCC 64411]|uniref:Pfs domain-containing protein n=1 Tax=Magnaporthiopsis poae (strain ATCC 64411 / 73-15) TaxID=644358 RepID=A0A0C4DNN6_MAGP6|nr:hypothetical protein MAPG_01429 [Magnaporthiopsis poae ATCC 64411]
MPTSRGHSLAAQLRNALFLGAPSKVAQEARIDLFSPIAREKFLRPLGEAEAFTMRRYTATQPSPDPDTTGIFDTKAAAPVYGDASGGRAIRVVERIMGPDEARSSWQTEPVRLIVSEPSSPIDSKAIEQPTPLMAQRASDSRAMPQAQAPTGTPEMNPVPLSNQAKTEATLNEDVPAADAGLAAPGANRSMQKYHQLDRLEQEWHRDEDGTARPLPQVILPTPPTQQLYNRLLEYINPGAVGLIQEYFLREFGACNECHKKKTQCSASHFDLTLFEQGYLGERPSATVAPGSPGPDAGSPGDGVFGGPLQPENSRASRQAQFGIGAPQAAHVSSTAGSGDLALTKEPVLKVASSYLAQGEVQFHEGLYLRPRDSKRELLDISDLVSKVPKLWLENNQNSLRVTTPSALETPPLAIAGLGYHRVPPGPNGPSPPATRGVGILPPAPSDSGYGSFNTCGVLHAKISADQYAASQVTDATTHDSKRPRLEGSWGRTANDDAATRYSDAGSLSDSRIDSCIGELADDLFDSLVTRSDVPVTRESMLRILHVLPGLLKYFALGLGYTQGSRLHLNIMYFVHMKRHAITAAVRNRYHAMAENDATARVRADDLPSSSDLVRGWLDDAHGIPDGEQFGVVVDGLDEVDQQEEEFDEDGIIQEIAEYTRLMVGSHAYRFLLANVRAEASLAQDGTMNKIRDTMTSALSPIWRRISRQRPPDVCMATFVVNWEPFTFLEEQGYAEPPEDAISNAVTVTGSSVDAQATTVAQYLAQTWPGIGLDVLSKIQDLLKGHSSVQGVLRDATRFEAKLERDPMTRLVLAVQGTPESIVQVAQVFAWLGAALRCSRYMDQPQTAYSVAHVEASEAYRGLGPKVNCKISFGYAELPTINNSHGQCWHGLFRKLAVVKGFPIPRRPEPGLGLEVPLNMMAALVGSSRLDLFDAKVFVKGFSAMLVPTLRHGNIVVWHLVAQGDDTRVSYLDWEGEHEQQLTMAEIETARHIVGWCSEVTFNVGGADAEYNIGRSLLPVAHAGCVLERAHISGGQLIHGSVTFGLGTKEKPINITHGGYIPKLKWVAGKYVILWDEEARRGWLVNGASALLHLLRASLEHCQRDKFKDAFLFDKSSFVEAEGLNNADSAIKVLRDARNLQLPLYSERSEIVQTETSKGMASEGQLSVTRTSRFYCLQDRVEHLYGILEKMIDHQTAVERRNGMQMPEWPRRQLEGWDFREVFADRDPLYPRVATLDTVGKGWVDFTRGIRAITLFGRGFGDMMRPAPQSAAAACTRWSTLPRGSCYLAATVSDLKEIMRIDGDLGSNPRRLSERVLWHSRETTFSPCPCGETTAAARRGLGPASRHVDPVQALFPSRFLAKLKRKTQAELPCEGAVVFGHNWSLHWHYRDSGDPQKGDPPSAVLEEDVEEKASARRPRADSGLGSSLVSRTCSNSQDGSSSDNHQAELGDGSSHSGSRTVSPATSHPADHNLDPKGSPPSPVESQDAILRGVKRRLASMTSSTKRIKLSRAREGTGTE